MIKRIFLGIAAAVSAVAAIWLAYCLYIRIQWELAPVRYPGLADMIQPGITIIELVVFTIVFTACVMLLRRKMKNDSTSDVEIES